MFFFFFFFLGGGGAHYERGAQSDLGLRPGSRARLRTLKALGFF